MTPSLKTVSDRIYNDLVPSGLTAYINLEYHCFQQVFKHQPVNCMDYKIHQYLYLMRVSLSNQNMGEVKGKKSKQSFISTIS